MKVAVVTYPMFAQVQGGLEIQIVETLAAVNTAGARASLIDTRNERLSDYDLVHVFAAGSGNFRIVQFAELLGVPVVLSPLIRPHWTKSLGRRARLAERILGKLTQWEVKSEYHELKFSLDHAARIFALGPIERDCIRAAFDIDDQKIEIVPNGIPARFFDSKPELFAQRFGVEPGFVLMVSSIDPHKNQLGMARALTACRVPLVMVGECHGANQSYLDEVLRIPGTRHVGSIPYADPLLASAYAAAGVFCLPSQSEVMPLSVLESLAAGTPAVMTRNHGMDTSRMAACVSEIDPADAAAIKQAVERFLVNPPDPDECRRAVHHLQWGKVGAQLVASYESVLNGRLRGRVERSVAGAKGRRAASEATS